MLKIVNNIAYGVLVFSICFLLVYLATSSLEVNADDSVSNDSTSVTENLVPTKPTYKRGTISEGVSQSLIPFVVYKSKEKSKKLVFVFGGMRTIGKNCGGMSLFTEIKNKNYKPGYNIVFVQKDKGSWKHYSQEAIGAMIEEITKDLKAKEVYFVGFSMGMYDAEYIADSKPKKWSGGLFIDGAGPMRWVKKKFKHSICVAGYDKGAYGLANCFDEY